MNYLFPDQFHENCCSHILLGWETRIKYENASRQLTVKKFKNRLQLTVEVFKNVSRKSLTKWSLKSKRFCDSWHFLKPSWCLHHHEKYQPREPRKKWTLRGLKEKLNRLVESLLRGRLLIPKIRIVNRHRQLHHLKEKEVFVLVKITFPTSTTYSVLKA